MTLNDAVRPRSVTWFCGPAVTKRGATLRRISRLVVLNTGIGARAPNEEWLRFQAFVRSVGTEIVVGLVKAPVTRIELPPCQTFR